MSYLDPKHAPLRIPLEDIVTATKGFAEENLLKRGRKADVYKGWLLRAEVGMDVVIRKYGSHTFEFYEEITRMSRFKHRHVVSFIGYCDEKDERMIVMEHAVHGALDKYLSDPTTLSWSQKLYICFGAALALTFRHNNSKYIYTKKSGFKILLDKDWEAKVLFGIESDTEKSDVYCLGVILLEVLYGRKATIEDVNQYVVSYTNVKQVDDITVHPHSLSVLSETTYDCFKSEECSGIHQIMERLKEAFEIQWKHENLLRVEKFASMKIPLTQIKLATDNFAYSYRVKSIRYDRVYKVELDYSDKESVSAIEGDPTGEPVKKTVIIKRFVDQMNYPKIIKDFYAEIEMLSCCKHPNLLTLIGFCDEESEMILVFECDFEDTLDDYLRNTNNRTNLSWEQRIRISLDIANGFNCLHKREETQAIHSVHVFLDEKWTAKIATFSISQFSSNEPWKPSGQSLVLDDIYFIGVTLFDVLTAGLVYDPHYMQKNVNEFASMACQHFKEGGLKKMADPSIKSRRI